MIFSERGRLAYKPDQSLFVQSRETSTADGLQIASDTDHDSSFKDAEMAIQSDRTSLISAVTRCDPPHIIVCVCVHMAACVCTHGCVCVCAANVNRVCALRPVSTLVCRHVCVCALELSCPQLSKNDFARAQLR